MSPHVRILALALVLSAAQTAVAPAQAPPPSSSAAPTKPAPLVHKPALPAAEREIAGAGLKPEGVSPPHAAAAPPPADNKLDYMSMLFVFMLATFIGLGVIMRVSRLLHTPLMSLTNAISAIAVVGSLMLAGGQQYSMGYRIVGAVAMFASMTNIISGFLITDRMLKMFKTRKGGPA
jgi:NAD(P) transhydrogenase subunit alpha